MLATLNLDSARTVANAGRKYDKIYGEREGIKKSAGKEKVATAVAITNALREEDASRPVRQIARLCQVDNFTSMLNAERALEGEGEDYSIEGTLMQSPEAYLDVLCANLGIPFNVASEMHHVTKLCDGLLKDMVDKNSFALTAAIMMVVLKRWYSHDKTKLIRAKKEICSMLECSPKTVDQRVRQVAEYLDLTAI